MDPLLYLIYLTRKIWRNFKATSFGILRGSKLENKKNKILPPLQRGSYDKLRLFYYV